MKLSYQQTSRDLFRRVLSNGWQRRSRSNPIIALDVLASKAMIVPSFLLVSGPAARLDQ